MSTIAPTQPITSPAADWIPVPLARLTVDQYEALIDSDVFTKRDSFISSTECWWTTCPRNDLM